MRLNRKKFSKNIDLLQGLPKTKQKSMAQVSFSKINISSEITPISSIQASNCYTQDIVGDCFYRRYSATVTADGELNILL